MPLVKARLDDEIHRQAKAAAVLTGDTLEQWIIKAIKTALQKQKTTLVKKIT